MPIARLPTVCATYWSSVNLSEEGRPCTVRSKLNKFERLVGGPCTAAWGPAHVPREKIDWQKDMTENITFQQLAEDNNCSCTLHGRKNNL